MFLPVTASLPPAWWWGVLMLNCVLCRGIAHVNLPAGLIQRSCGGHSWDMQFSSWHAIFWAPHDYGCSFVLKEIDPLCWVWWMKLSPWNQTVNRLRCFLVAIIALQNSPQIFFPRFQSIWSLLNSKAILPSYIQSMGVGQNLLEICQSEKNLLAISKMVPADLHMTVPSKKSRECIFCIHSNSQRLHIVSIIVQADTQAMYQAWSKYNACFQHCCYFKCSLDVIWYIFDTIFI